MPIDPRDLLPPELRSDLYLEQLIGGSIAPPAFASSPTDDLNAALGSAVLAQTWDGSEATDVSGTGPWTAGPGDGNLYLTAILLREPAVVTGICANVRQAGVFTDGGENRMGLYALNAAETAFERLAIGPDPASGAEWKTAGMVQENFTGGPIALEAGVYWCALIYNQAGQTTAPRLLALSGTTTLANPLMTSNYKARAIFDAGALTVGASPAVGGFAQHASPFWHALF